MTTTDNKKIKLVADVALFNKDKVLLCRYNETINITSQDGLYLMTWLSLMSTQAMQQEGY